MALTVADIYSQANRLKRRVQDFASNPLESLLQTAGYGQQRMGEFRQLNEIALQGDLARAKGMQPTPEQMAAENKVRDIWASAYNPAGIVSPSAVRAMQMKTTLPTDELFTRAVQNTPTAQITPEGLAIRLERMQKPEQAAEESVRTGVFYLPEGSVQMKHYSTGKSGYGGTEKISGETIYKNPLFVKGATGGKAPEAAYDQLMGKGAYQKMREEAVQAAGVMNLGNRLTTADKAERIARTLQEHGIEDNVASDMAYNILANSKHSNQLPYAIQENIVAHAVRKAGHDAVLGYSVKRNPTKDPFISEVFDVRESHYPTTSGEFWLNPEFEQLLKKQ